MQVTRPMYARKLVKLVSKIPEPSGNLIYHCQYHQSMKVKKGICVSMSSSVI